MKQQKISTYRNIFIIALFTTIKTILTITFYLITFTKVKISDKNVLNYELHQGKKNQYSSPNIINILKNTFC